MLPPSAPVPLQATFTLATKILTVDFDKLLVGQPTAASNWFAWDGIFRYQNIPGLGFALLRRVTVHLPAIMPDFGAIRCTYLGAIPDVIGRNGLPVAPFIGFPLTIV